MSKKYVIEIKPEYEDSFKGVMLLGAKDSNLFVDTLAVDNLEELNSDYINDHYGDLQDDAYERGHGIGYQKGFEDGKAAYDKGCVGCKYEDRTSGQEPCCKCARNDNDYWTAKQTDDRIEVGDEVADKGGDKTIVTNIHGELFDGLCSDGSTMTDLFLDDNRKTGRHFDIASILKEMQND